MVFADGSPGCELWIQIYVDLSCADRTPLTWQTRRHTNHLRQIDPRETAAS
eukprot:SAG31_NODE_14733_length_790_cov_0.978292_1_plen_50_part_10